MIKMVTDPEKIVDEKQGENHLEELAKILNSAINDLPPQQELLIRMASGIFGDDREIEMSLQEIAEETGLGKKIVALFISEGLKNLGKNKDLAEFGRHAYTIP